MNEQIVHMTPLADSLRQRARELKISHAEVARRAGLSERRYGNYVNGVREPDLQTLARISSALETTPNDLLRFKSTPVAGPMRKELLKRLNEAAATLGDRELEICVVQAEAVNRLTF